MSLGFVGYRSKRNKKDLYKCLFHCFCKRWDHTFTWAVRLEKGSRVQSLHVAWMRVRQRLKGQRERKEAETSTNDGDGKATKTPGNIRQKSRTAENKEVNRMDVIAIFY